MNNKLALFINHNIFFTNDHYEKLLENNKVKLIGVCVPVWVNAKTTKTTEPAIEFFCEYQIINNFNKKENIKILKKGYNIFLPNGECKAPEKIIFEELSNMKKEQREYYDRKRDRWWQKNPEIIGIQSLIRTKYLKIKIKKLDQEFKKLNCFADVQHSVNIKPIEILLNNMNY